MKHEKLHFEISCIIAKKGNIEIGKGKDFDKVGEKVTDFQNKININNGSGQGDYDEESKHRCDQAKQDEWNTKVLNSLPGVVLS
ncbi:MAG: hypothetical protein IPL53_22115 [Ignavibacteria bacterium]|nr:hypothetical protein [Ignavibacteria bacterium]